MAGVENSFNKKEIKDNLNSLPNGAITAPFVNGNAEILRANTTILTTYTLQALDLSRIIRIPSSVVSNFDITIPQSFTGPSARRFIIINESDAVVRLVVDGTLTLNYATDPFVLTKNTLFDIYRVSSLNYVVVNSGGATPQFIPLSGTTENNFVTGDVEFGVTNDGGYGKIGLRNDVISLISGDKELNPTNFRDNTYNGAFLNEGGQFRVENGTNTESIGLYSNTDFSEISSTNKLVYAQRSYVENPQTLINALNNCDATQLATIKTILGII